MPLDKEYTILTTTDEAVVISKLLGDLQSHYRRHLSEADLVIAGLEELLRQNQIVREGESQDYFDESQLFHDLLP